MLAHSSMQASKQRQRKCEPHHQNVVPHPPSVSFRYAIQYIANRYDVKNFVVLQKLTNQGSQVGNSHYQPASQRLNERMVKNAPKRRGLVHEMSLGRSNTA